MSDYAKIEIKFTYSKNSDYSDPEQEITFAEFETTPDEYEVKVVEADTGGTTVELGNFATIEAIIVQNLDPTNYVDATWRTTGGSTNDQVIQVSAGDSLVLPCDDITIASDLVLTANSAACRCRVAIIGS